MTTFTSDYDSDPERYLASAKYPHDDVHPYVAANFLAACAPDRDSSAELAPVLPHWGEPSTFDGEDAQDIVASVFRAPGDRVEVDRWDGPLVTLHTAAHAAGFLRSHQLSEAEATRSAATFSLPMTLTMRGCVVYATKADR